MSKNKMHEEKIVNHISRTSTNGAYIFISLLNHTASMRSSTTAVPSILLTVTLPSCESSFEHRLDHKVKRTHLVAKVRCLCHVAEQANFDNSCQHLDSCHNLPQLLIKWQSERLNVMHTVYGSFITSRENGASMMKLPLSETTGPAFAFAIRSVALGEPSIWWRFCKTLAYAKGTTSIGTPGVNYVGQREMSKGTKT